ncbi:MAG: T9SS type A sorting domain-containing protein [Ignavibacteria bacterium]|jgi:hypothetical protein|nr:T9SS type A sorting domain-containing protein [Ignavibacteria bacterium]MDH7528949.1 T9SS type A sorting domain-containing protein [Ignavibacteria bacterium]
MKKFLLLYSIPLLISFNLKAQVVWDSSWYCAYATWDHPDANATGYNTASVAVFAPNTFVAVINRPSNNTAYLVGYRNADSSNGRLGTYGYGTTGVGGFRMQWISGFDVVEMLRPWDIAGKWGDTLIYVANNDTVERNILVFSLGQDSVYSTDYRMATLDNKPIFGIDVDAAGRVYVTKEGNETNEYGRVLIYNSIQDDPGWSGLHYSQPLQIITVPELGYIRGVAVSPDGKLIYVSNYSQRKVYCYVGSPTQGYTLYNGFNFTITDTIPNAAGKRPGPLNLKFMPEKNILLVACDSLLGGSSSYPYGRVYFVNPNTGEVIDTIDAAAWNFYITGAYNNRGADGKQGNVSGYTSLYGVDCDNEFNVYTVSYYGWTVDKWIHTFDLPTIPITILNVEKTDVIPENFDLKQNYPNPFNPQTTIEFSLVERSKVSLVVYNAIGEVVEELISNSEFDAGTYKFTFDASKLSSGTYFYSLINGSNKITKKMTLIK